MAVNSYQVLSVSSQRDSSTLVGSFKGLCYRHTCHTLSRLQSGTSRNCLSRANPYITCSSSAGWTECVTAPGPTLASSKSWSLSSCTALYLSASMSKSHPLLLHSGWQCAPPTVVIHFTYWMDWFSSSRDKNSIIDRHCIFCSAW